MRLRIAFSSCILLIGLSNVSAQVLFQRVYGGESYDRGCEVIQTPDDGYLIAGTTGSFGLSSGQIMLIKTDEEGYEEWRKYHGGSFAEVAESMQETADGNLIIGGYSETTENSYQVYAAKLSMIGDTIWTRSYGGADWDFCRQLVSLPDGGFAVFGQTFSYGAGNGDFYLLRLNSNGDTLWTKTYGGPELESGESIALASDGGFYLAGYTTSFGAGMHDIYVVRTDQDGDTLWTKTFGGPEDDFGYAIDVTPDDGYVVAGGTNNNTPGKSDFTIIKDEGTSQWVRNSSYFGDNYWLDVIVEPVGNVTATGYFTEGGAGKEDARMTRYGADGVFNGMAMGHGSADNDRAYDIKLTSDGGYVIVGFTEGFMERFDDVYLVKTNVTGQTVGPELGVNEIFIDGTLFEVSVGPNPFSSVTPEIFIQNYEELITRVNKPIALKVFNAMGQQVYASDILLGIQRLEGLNVNSGFYSYQIVSGESMLATGKLLKVD
jgi:uncharacterized delta-60 repeat protein